MNTVVKSPTQTVLIGPEQPFVIIGERINPTGRKRLEAEMLAGDLSRVERDALAQVAAGAHILDINSGVTSIEPHKTEPELMTRCIELVQTITDAPLCIDSSVVPALIAGIQAAKGRPIVNSVTGEEERLESVLPVVAEYDVPVIAISNDESGISYDPKVRFAVAKKIVKRAESYGIKPQDVIIDPLAMPIGAVRTAGIDLFTIVRMVREELGCNTVCGASNISFGLPNRAAINSAFVPMAMAAGMTCAITNPLEKEIRHAVYAADVLMGNDQDCMRYLAAMREAEADASGSTSAGDDRRAARAARRASRRERLSGNE
ncbi:MAG: dihydropteroate synthase [Caldilineaceae bacterium]|nr:dihydropteroate synthase [Caldilineaceae bacterium]MCB9151199.1 dihydropteroate synthase [Caldilineaceae bacterium]MCB9156211.1 dihydropteroate synthase [Caldilineaceae bacterium]